MNNFTDDSLAPVSKGMVEIQSRFLGVSSPSFLRLHSNFHGLRYFMYHYPLASGIVGITFISIFVCSILLLILGNLLDPVTSSEVESTRMASKSEQLHSKLKNCPNFEKVMHKVNEMKDTKDPNETSPRQRQVRAQYHHDLSNCN